MASNSSPQTTRDLEKLETIVYEHYRTIRDCIAAIKKPKNREDFFKDFLSIIENMTEIAKLENLFQFGGRSVSARLSELKELQEGLFKQYIFEQYDIAKRKALTLKTERGRAKSLQTFFENMDTCKAYMSNSCIHFLFGLKNFAPDACYLGPILSLDSIDEICNFAIVYYRNGYVTDLCPRDREKSIDEQREIPYEAKNIVSDGDYYDLNKPDDIASIKVPDFSRGGHVVLNMSYIFKMWAGRERRPQIAEHLIPKTAQLMRSSSSSSTIGWTPNDYRRLVEQLWAVGKFELGNRLMEEYHCDLEYEKLSEVDDARLHFKGIIQWCQELGTDLVEMSAQGSTCGECAKYEGRVYSISGKDKRFPKLPEQILKCGCVHPGCRHSFYPYDYYDGAKSCKYITDPDEETYHIDRIDTIEYSNRPFLDLRNKKQREEYAQYLLNKENAERIWNLKKEYYARLSKNPESMTLTLREFLRHSVDKKG